MQLHAAIPLTVPYGTMYGRYDWVKTQDFWDHISKCDAAAARGRIACCQVRKSMVRTKPTAISE